MRDGGDHGNLLRDMMSNSPAPNSNQIPSPSSNTSLDVDFRSPRYQGDSSYLTPNAAGSNGLHSITFGSDGQALFSSNRIFEWKISKDLNWRLLNSL